MKNQNLLSGFEFFSNIPHDKISEIEQQCEILDFGMNDIIFHINKTAENLYGVIRGEVALFITFWDQKMAGADIEPASPVLPQCKILQTPIVVDTIRAGEIFGWSSMLNHKKWTASAKCIVPARIFSLSAAFLKDISHEDPATGCISMEKLCDIILRRLQNRTDKMFERKINAIGKMLHFMDTKPRVDPSAVH